MTVHQDFDPDRSIAPGPETADGYGRFLVSQLERVDVIVLVAEVDGTVLGHAYAYAYAGLEGNDWTALRGPAGVIHDIVVDPGRRREGIGRRLLQAAIGSLTEHGAPRVVLSPAKRNDVAQSLFAAEGFRPTMIEMTRERAKQLADPELIGGASGRRAAVPTPRKLMNDGWALRDGNKRAFREVRPFHLRVSRLPETRPLENGALMGQRHVRFSRIRSQALSTLLRHSSSSGPMTASDSKATLGRSAMGPSTDAVAPSHAPRAQCV